MSTKIDWSGSSGDVWARRWPETDRSLGPVGAALDRMIDRLAPDGPFRVLDVGCGPGTTSLALADRRADAEIVGCDLSRPLVEIARSRSSGRRNVQFFVEDARSAALTHGPFDLILSRHGVMFFDDPTSAFRAFRKAVVPAAALVFTCFQGWRHNPWASELADAAAGSPQPSPGREPSGFAFAEPKYVEEILSSSGWGSATVDPITFSYVAGEGPTAVEEALGLFAEIGPASRILQGFSEPERVAALSRMREVVERRTRGNLVEFPAAAWLWTARAA